jgi:hypothetical protein
MVLELLLLLCLRHTTDVGAARGIPLLLVLLLLLSDGMMLLMHSGAAAAAVLRWTGAAVLHWAGAVDHYCCWCCAPCGCRCVALLLLLLSVAYHCFGRCPPWCWC